MKKILYFSVTLLEIALFIGAYFVNYFAMKKMGMMRWVNFTCTEWEKNYPIAAIKCIVIALLLSFTVLTIVIFVKRRKSLKKLTYIMVMGMIILTAFSLGYIFSNSFSTVRAYYLMSIMYAITALLQIVKTFVGIAVCRNE